MASQIPLQPALQHVQPPRFADDATDSGYGGSVIDGSSHESDDMFDKSFSNEAQPRYHIPSARQQEIYKENCHLLTGSIDETKHILKVPPLHVCLH
jgi:hypothetical protein